MTSDFMEEVFWADKIAEKVIERAKRENRVPNIRCAQTPSGGKHVGNLNDVIRAYFVYKSLIGRGHKASFVHTTDDRDPMKDIPKRVTDLNGNWHEISSLGDFTKYLGVPYINVPDPFDCCKNWAEHFTKVWMNGVHALGMKPELVSVDKLYRDGKLDPYIKIAFEKIELAREIIKKYQENIPEDFIPYNAICEKCGRITASVTSFDLKKWTVKYVCSGKRLKKREVLGCGHSGETDIGNGKLTWRFEWPAMWGIFKTTHEPFGKDHYEGSWPSGKEIAERLYEFEPPIPFVYEFFLVDGKKMSASKGNVYIVQDILKIIEPEVFSYFYTKRPGKQRDLDLKNIFSLVDEFDSVERKYFELDKIKDGRERENVKRSYEMSMEIIAKKIPLRIQYTFASLIGQVVPQDKMLEKALVLLKYTGHVKTGLGSSDKKLLEKRLKLATYWAQNYAEDEYKVKVLEKVTPDILNKLNDKQKKSLRDLAKVLKEDLGEKELYNKFFEIAKNNNIDTKELFKAAYLVLIGRESGPRLAPFILTIGREEVIKKIKSI